MQSVPAPSVFNLSLNEQKKGYTVRTQFIGDIKAIRLIRHDDGKSMQIIPSCQLVLQCVHPQLMALSDGCTICLFQPLNSHTFLNLFNMIENSFTTPQCNSLTTLLCIPCGPKHLCISIWLKCFIIPSTLVLGNAPLCQWTLVLEVLRTALPWQKLTKNASSLGSPKTVNQWRVGVSLHVALF